MQSIVQDLYCAKYQTAARTEDQLTCPLRNRTWIRCLAVKYDGPSGGLEMPDKKKDFYHISLNTTVCTHPFFTLHQSATSLIKISCWSIYTL